MISVFDHPWNGALFADPVCREAWSAERQIAHFVSFESALSTALERAGRVEAGMGRAAAAALAGFRPDLPKLRRAMATDGVPIPELVRQMRAACGPAAEAVHTGATSQDVLDTALVLTLQEVTDHVLARLDELIASLGELIERFGQNTLMGRTRMQAALPITVASRLLPVEAALRGHATRLASLRPQVERLQLGGAVGTNAALGADAPEIAASIASRLGLVPPSGHAWHTDRASLVDYANALALISGTLGKFGQDIALMAQQGIDEVRLAGGGGSSAMPHKSNPVKAELLITLARFNAGHAGLMHQSMLHEQERSGAAWMLEWMVLPQITCATGCSLIAANQICADIEGMGG
ncbi:MAG: 3-carboxy-cis,cis-muconate cycloisomerase [Pseudomonadota bacterium]